MATVKRIIGKLQHVEFKVVVESAKPSNVFLGKEFSDITNWRYCDVMNMLSDGSPLGLVKLATGASEKKILQSKARDFVAFLRFILDELKKIALLEEKLRGGENPDLAEAGIDKLNVFGVATIYNAISPDPRHWDEIAELPYHKIWAKMMLDKTNAEIQKAYDTAQANKMRKK